MSNFPLFTKEYDENSNPTRADRMNYDRMIIITNDKWFKAKVRQARKVLEIPPKGLKDFDGDRNIFNFVKHGNWLNKHFERADEAFENNCPENNPENFLQDFKNEVIDHYQLLNNLDCCIEYYLLFNKIVIPRTGNYSVDFKSGPSNKQKNGSVNVKVFGYLTKDEEKDLNKNIQDHLCFQKRNELENIKGHKGISEAISMLQDKRERFIDEGERGDRKAKYLDIAARKETEVDGNELHRMCNRLSKKKTTINKYAKKLFPDTSIDLGI